MVNLWYQQSSLLHLLFLIFILNTLQVNGNEIIDIASRHEPI